MTRSLRDRLKKIRCLLLDVDGVLTDGKIYFSSNGDEYKAFDVLDGHGIAMAKRAGLTVGFVSGRPSKATEARAANLGVDIVYQKEAPKMEAICDIEQKFGFKPDEICFIGDELVDVLAMHHVGVAVAVANAVDEVKREADYVTKRAGGSGAVREVVELILKSQGTWTKTIAKYVAIFAILALPTAIFAQENDAKRTIALPSGEVHGFEVPERDADGNLRWILKGETGRMRADGLVEITEVRAEMYESNAVALVFSAPHCVFDHKNKRAETDAPVLIERENLKVTGLGAVWDAAAQTFVVKQDARVVIFNLAKGLKTEEPSE
jgi:3-deoxy-D-manno-octulosonate 8-phosphate phosphatase (KDO 8-P phosphatase)